MTTVYHLYTLSHHTIDNNGSAFGLILRITLRLLSQSRARMVPSSDELQTLQSIIEVCMIKDESDTIVQDNIGSPKTSVQGMDTQAPNTRSRK